MTSFWIVSAALALIAPLFVLLPLVKTHRRAAAGPAGDDPKLSVYRDQLAELVEDRRSGRLGEGQYAQARDELESRIVQEMPEANAAVMGPAPRHRRTLAVAAAVAVPLLAVLGYLGLGNLDALRPQRSEVAHGLGQQQMDAMIARLAARLEKEPDDPKGWVMLARAQAVLGRFDEASAAYARSVALVPGDAQLLADYADALAMAQGGRLRGEPEELVKRALRADPDNAKALALAGTVAFEKKDFVLAVIHWERLRASVPPDSEFAKSVQANIEEAKSLAGPGGTVRQASDEPAGSRVRSSK